MKIHITQHLIMSAPFVSSTVSRTRERETVEETKGADMIKCCVIWIFIAALGLAQPSQLSAVRGSISGTVTNAETRAPIPQASVSAITATPVSKPVSPTAEAKRITATTDAQGRYSLADLPFGQYLDRKSTRLNSQSPM